VPFYFTSVNIISSYNYFCIGNTTPDPDTVLTVIVYKAEDPLVVASSNIITLSELSGIVILLFAPSVPVNLI
jgi:hypothetical protein